MPNTFQCPACGGLIEYSDSNQDMVCPFCGTAVTTPGQATATVVIPRGERPQSAVAQTMIQQSRFNSSAEIMDEVKRLLREGDKPGATKVYRKELGVSQADAKTAVDQIEIDMKHLEEPPAPVVVESAPPPPSPVSEPAISGDVVFNAAPEKPSSTKNWIIGCSIALVVFCCLCVILPTIVTVVVPLINK